jgi:hypothetical protein
MFVIMLTKSHGRNLEPAQSTNISATLQYMYEYCEVCEVQLYV